MNIEYEATFIPIDKDKMRQKLKAVGAKLERPEFFQKRSVFALPKNHDIKNGWLRVRDEGDKITLSLKSVVAGKIHDQKEICVIVNDFYETNKLIESLGYKTKSYQENYRELWMLDGVEITIDTWPFLELLIEVEGKSEEGVKSVSEKLGFNWKNAKFCSADTLYKEKYGVSEYTINNETPKIVFDMNNPFIEKDSSSSK